MPRRSSKRPRPQIDVLADVLSLYGGFSFNSDELREELEHYCRIVKKKPPHHTTIGKRLSGLGYVKSREYIDGRKVSVYRYDLKQANQLRK